VTLLDNLETTEQVITRHVLLCGVPGIGKSMLAKAAYSLLDPPTQEIHLRHNKALPDRPIVVISQISNDEIPNRPISAPSNVLYSSPDRLPIEIAIKMGYRCSKCSSLSTPLEPACTNCGTDKRTTHTMDSSECLTL